MLLLWLDLSATHMLLSLHNLFNPFSKKFKLQILCVHPVIPDFSCFIGKYSRLSSPACVLCLHPPCCTAAMQLLQAMRRRDPLLSLSRVLHTADESNVWGGWEEAKSHAFLYTQERCITNVKNELFSLLLQLHPLLFWSHSQLHHILCRTQQLLSWCLWYLKTPKKGTFNVL